MQQKPFLAPEAAAETHELPVFSDYTVAWNDNGDGISSVCIAYRTAGFNISHRGCYILI